MKKGCVRKAEAGNRATNRSPAPDVYPRIDIIVMDKYADEVADAAKAIFKGKGLSMSQIVEVMKWAGRKLMGSPVNFR